MKERNYKYKVYIRIGNSTHLIYESVFRDRAKAAKVAVKKLGYHVFLIIEDRYS